MQNLEEANVRVYVRIRPVIHNEDEHAEAACVRATTDKELELVNWRDTDETLKYEFEQVFSEDANQDEIYCTAVTPVLSRFTDLRHNVTVLTYGPTGSGKTHTLLGTNTEPGIIPRTLQSLFRKIRKTTNSNEETVTLSMSYLEVYCEKVIDLLRPTQQNLQIHADNKGNIFVPGLTEKEINNFDSFERIFIPASKNRSVGFTKINARSSRSHTILSIQMRYQNTSDPNKVEEAKLHLIDLAGSEDNRRTGNVGQRLKESGAINTSLHVFKKVINSLHPNFKGRIPYRESKLTRLLQDSLGGTAHVSLIINVAPEMSNVYDTTSALNFALKSKSVINRPFTHVVEDKNIILHTPKQEIQVERDESNITERTQPLLLISPFLQKNSSSFNPELIKRLQSIEKSMLSNKENITDSPTAVQCFRSQEKCLQEIRKSAKKLKMLPEKRKLFKEEENLSSNDSKLNSSLNLSSPIGSPSSEIGKAHTEIVQYQDFISPTKVRCLDPNEGTILTLHHDNNQHQTTVTMRSTKHFTKEHENLVLKTLNSGCVDELVKLPNVGRKRAEIILQYCNKNGPIKQVSDLQIIFSEKFIEKLVNGIY